MEIVRAPERRTEQFLRPGQVQVGLVNRRHFDERRESFQNSLDPAGVFQVLVRVSLEKHSLRTAPMRLPQRHGRVDAELPGGIRRSRHDAALSRPSTHHDRPPLERRVRELLYGHEERVHVEVENDGWRFGVEGQVSAVL